MHYCYTVVDKLQTEAIALHDERLRGDVRKHYFLLSACCFLCSEFVGTLDHSLYYLTISTLVRYLYKLIQKLHIAAPAVKQLCFKL